MAAITGRLHRRLPDPITMPNGKPAKHRLFQTILWSALVAACSAALIAGLYFNTLEVNWHVFYLKDWWDGGMGLNITKTASWSLYRHGYRDQGEPEVAFLIVGTLIAKRKAWSRRAPWWYMILAPVLLLAVSAAGITGAIWVLNFGLPKLLHVHVLNHYLLLGGTLVFGIVLGHIVKPIWTPVGSTINGWLIDRSVDRHALRKEEDPGLKPPLWVRHWFLAPLFVRERWVWQSEHNEKVSAHRDLPGWAKILTGVIAGLLGLAVAYLIVTGFIAHFWIGSGHDFPFLAPKG